MLGRRWLAHAQLLGDEHDADAVNDEIAIDLPREMGLRILEPFEDQQPPLVGQGTRDFNYRHIGKLLYSNQMSTIDIDQIENTPIGLIIFSIIFVFAIGYYFIQINLKSEKN